MNRNVKNRCVDQAAKQLLIADQQRLVRLLNPPKTLEHLAEEQEIKPMAWEAAAECARGIWPEEDCIDDFLAFLTSRTADRSRESV